MRIEKRIVFGSEKPLIRFQYPEHLAGQQVEVNVYVLNDFLEQLTGDHRYSFSLANTVLNPSWGSGITDAVYKTRRITVINVPRFIQESVKVIAEALAKLNSLEVIPGRDDFGTKGGESL